jgi:hypothetical protein
MKGFLHPAKAILPNFVKILASMDGPISTIAKCQKFGSSFGQHF